MKVALLALLCTLAVVSASPTSPATAAPTPDNEWVFAEIVDNVKEHMEAFKKGIDTTPVVPSLVETETGTYAVPGMYYHPGFYPPVAPGYYGYFGYQPTYTHPYLSTMPRFATTDPPAAAVPHPAASSLSAYTQYGFPYSSFPPIPPPMPTYLPPPPYIPPDGFNADGSSAGAAGAGAGAAPAAGGAPAAAPAAS